MRGCPACDHQGYRGRLALLEVLRISTALDELVGRGASAGELFHAAINDGFRTLAEDGLARVREGATSLEELRRVVDLTEHVHGAVS